ncbi:MAG: hypothetical protein K2W82_00210 [Candidatus Obscuribacterales bacterium]|nr:hypothetical protein [Candidatus Obscuribacterales bacterium]
MFIERTKCSVLLSLLCCALLPVGAEEISGGPLAPERQQLLNSIKQAGSAGIGTSGYMQAFQALEEQIKSGASEAAVSQRLDGIKRSLAEQMQRSKLLKTQKPVAPQGSQIRGGEAPAAQAATQVKAQATGAAAETESAMIDKMREKYGDRIDEIPPGLRERLNDPAVRQKLMEKYGGR